MSLQTRLASTSITMDLLSVSKKKDADPEKFLEIADKIHKYITKDEVADVDDLFSSGTIN